MRSSEQIISRPEVTIRDKQFVIKIEAAEIQKRVAELARQITTDFAGTVPILVGVLNGSALFVADLFRRLDLNCELTFIRVSSYDGLQTTGNISQVMGLKENIADRHVLVVEDIIDTGHTAMRILDDLKKLQPASLKMATCLFKPMAMKHDYRPDYIGFEVAPDFLVGYGLDYDGLGRNLNDIYVLKS